MIIASILSKKSDDNRIFFSADTIKKYKKNNIEVVLPSNYGLNSNLSDDELMRHGASIDSEENILAKVDILVVFEIEESFILKLKKNSNIVCLNYDYEINNFLFKDIQKKNINIFSLNLLPRITRAQSMDILSSQANLAGYKSVIDSTYEFKKAVPMMMTAAGTVSPAKFFIIGAGVAGLQAIATAK